MKLYRGFYLYWKGNVMGADFALISSRTLHDAREFFAELFQSGKIENKLGYSKIEGFLVEFHGKVQYA